MKDFSIYLLMVSFKREHKAISIVKNFLAAREMVAKANFIVIENSPVKKLPNYFNFESHPDIIYQYHPNKNKAAAINYAIRELIKEKEAFIICIDNDIRFKQDYLLKYSKAAMQNGSQFYFGTSFFVNIPENINRKLIPYFSGAALGQPDVQYQNMQKLMFSGCSYAFFKSQWKLVNGLDERFSPGSTYNLGGDESIFQKKLKHVGFKPFLVKNNAVEHLPELKLYTLRNVTFRHEQNGLTHAFQNIIISHQYFKWDYFKQLAGFLKKCFILTFQKDKLKTKMEWTYTKGYFKGFLVYLRIKNKKTYLNSKG